MKQTRSGKSFFQRLLESGNTRKSKNIIDLRDETARQNRGEKYHEVGNFHAVAAVRYANIDAVSTPQHIAQNEKHSLKAYQWWDYGERVYNGNNGPPRRKRK